MGKGLLKPRTTAKKTAGSGRGGNGGQRLMNNSQLGAAFAKKEYSDAVKLVLSYMKKHQHHATRLANICKSGVLHESQNSELLPSSTNKFRLLSFGNCKDILRRVFAKEKGATKEFHANFDKIQTKSELVQIMCFLFRVCDTCAIPSRSTAKLVPLLRDRFREQPTRIDRLHFKDNGKKGKSSGMAPDFSNGVFALTDWDDNAGKYKSITHQDSSTKVDLWDDIKVGTNMRMLDNWNEYTAKLKGKSEHSCLAFFNTADEDKDPDFGEVPLPKNDDVIRERTGGKADQEDEEEEQAPGDAPTIAAAASSEPRRKLSRKTSAASEVAPPPGWGGAKKD